MDSLNPGLNNVPDLSRYRIIGAPCEVLIPPEKRSNAQKLSPKTEPGRLLAMLSFKTFLVWVPTKRTVVKTPFIKLKESSLLKEKTTILKDLSVGEGDLLGLVTEEGGSDLGENVAPEKPNSPVTFNFNSSKIRKTD